MLGMLESFQILPNYSTSEICNSSSSLLRMRQTKEVTEHFHISFGVQCRDHLFALSEEKTGLFPDTLFHCDVSKKNSKECFLGHWPTVCFLVLPCLLESICRLWIRFELWPLEAETNFFFCLPRAYQSGVPDHGQGSLMLLKYDQNNKYSYMPSSPEYPRCRRDKNYLKLVFKNTLPHPYTNLAISLLWGPHSTSMLLWLL